MTQSVEVEGLTELIKSMEDYPAELTKAQAITMSASLNTFWEKVPPYPKQDSMSNYRRTGTLGKSLGSSMNGGATGGSPSIYTIKTLGSGFMEGSFGSNLEYAPYVIGEVQAGMHSSNWWNIITIAQRAADKVERLWKDLGDKLASFLERKKI